VSGRTKKEGVVVISDNCKGIPNIEKIVQNIGNSDKKAQPWTNGQFGYGMCSFIACCEKLTVVSRVEATKPLGIEINKDHFLVDKQEDFIFSDPQEVDDFEHESGTKVTLQKFNKNDWKNISIEDIKGEVEKHFELLLSRSNLEIRLISEGRVYTCESFDYSKYDGNTLEEDILDLPDASNNHSPVHCFIKITKGKDLNKRPVFIIKGRRINEIKNITAFKTKNKSDIWNHPNVTGYINLGNYIEPDISRNGFAAKHKERSSAVFNYLVSKESEILGLIREGNEESQERHYQKLEDMLNKALSKLARQDSMNFRTEVIRGRDIVLEDGAESSEDGSFLPNSSDPNENNGADFPGDDMSNPSDQVGGSDNLNKESENPFEDKTPEGTERKRSGFNMKISDLDPNIDETGRKIKSRLISDTIEIFRKHPEFEGRLEHFRGGEPKVTQRLITYLAGEITVHYKDRFYMKTGQPEYNKRMFEDLVDFIYLFEDSLKDAVGKNLSLWSE